MAESDRLEQGRQVAKRLFGERRAMIMEESLANMSSGFQEFVLQAFCIYDRPGLDWKTRSAVTIAVLASLGRAQEVALHIRGGLNVGLTKEQIREILTQVAVYAGVPVAVEAFLVANRVFEKTKQEEVS